MYEIVTILGIIYLLYRIKFFYKEGNYNQVKSTFSGRGVALLAYPLIYKKNTLTYIYIKTKRI